jgi:Transcription factor WhiB
LAVEPRPWAVHALCFDRPEDWVFEVRGKNTTKESREGIEAALATCHRCPVELECRVWALQYHETMPGAVVGGLTPVELRAARNKPLACQTRRFLQRPRCGTSNAYAFHLEFGEDCVQCREANTRRGNPEGTESQIYRAS